MRSMPGTIATVALLALSMGAGCSGRLALTSETIADDGVIYHLPKTILTLTVRQYSDTDNGRVFYTLGGPGADKGGAVIDEEKIFSDTIPDPRHRYVIKYHPDAFSDDRLCLSRSPDGLLHDVQFAADDRTPQIAFNIAQFIGGFIGGKVAYQQGELTPPKVAVRAYTGTVDPFDSGTVTAFNNGLASIFGTGVRVDFSRMRDMLAASASTWPAGCTLGNGSLKDDDCPRQKWAERCSPGHICYRTTVEVPVYLMEGGKSVDVKYAAVVNAWDIGTISVTRAFMVQKITKLRFQDGALVAAIVRKPSEVEEATLLPLNVMNAILSVPSGLWKGAFADTNTKTMLLQQMAKNEGAIQQLNTNRNALLLSGEPASSSTTENYKLNCRDPSTGATTLNLLGG